MPEPILNGAGVVAGVRQSVAAAMPQHVAVNREGEQKTRAESLFGIAIQLTVLKMQYEEQDKDEAVQAALASIDHLIGTEFASSVDEIEQYSMGSYADRGV